MFRNAVEIFNIFGFKIRIDPSWLLIAALIVWNLSMAYFPGVLGNASQNEYFVLAIIAMLGLFASLLFHELAHSLMARRFNLKVGSITLFLFGGVAELEHEPKDPKSEFWIAIAGPIASISLAGASMLTISLFQLDTSKPLFAVANYLFIINLFVAIFNMVPAFPLDGGRVLRAVLWKHKGDLLDATRIASRFGTFFGLALMGLGVLSIFSSSSIGGFWQILIGFFLVSASRASYQQLLMKTLLKDHAVDTLMTRNFISADANDLIDTFVADVMLKRNVSFVPVTDGEQLHGYVDTKTIGAIDRENWSSTRLGDIYVPSSENNTAPPNLPTEKLFEKMTETGQRKFLIAEDGILLGVITLSDLTAFLAISQGLAPQQKNIASQKKAV